MATTPDPTPDPPTPDPPVRTVKKRTVLAKRDCKNCSVSRLRYLYTDVEWNKGPTESTCDICLQSQTQYRRVIAQVSPTKTQQIAQSKKWKHMFVNDNFKWEKCKCTSVNRTTKIATIEFIGAEAIIITTIPVERLAIYNPAKIGIIPATYKHILAATQTKTKQLKQTIKKLKAAQKKQPEETTQTFLEAIDAAAEDDDAQPISRAGIQQLITTSVNNALVRFRPTDKYTDYAKRMEKIQQMIPFKGKFPFNERTYYDYTLDIHQFYSENTDVDEEILFKTIIKSLSKQQRENWYAYKNDAFDEYAEMVNNNDDPVDVIDDTNRQQEQSAYFKSIQTTADFETFILTYILQIAPTEQYFTKQLSLINCKLNELPSESFRRFRRYVNQMQIVIRKLNLINTGSNIRALKDYEINESLYRMFITNNNCVEHNNSGKLNKQVKKKLIGKHRINTTALSYRHIQTTLQQIEQEVLPKEAIKYNIFGEFWKTYRTPATIFQINSNTQPKPYNKYNRYKNRNRPYNTSNTFNKGNRNDRYGSAPPWKRQRRTPNNRESNQWANKRKCRFGVTCRDLQNGSCNYKHTKQDRQMVQKQPQQSKPNFKTDKYGKNRQKNREDCQWGIKCYGLHDGNCTKWHDWKQVKCKHCGNNHATYRCQRDAIKRRHYQPDTKPNSAFSKMSKQDMNTLAMKIAAIQTKNNKQNGISNEVKNKAPFNMKQFSKSFKNVAQQQMNGMANIFSNFTKQLDKYA